MEADESLLEVQRLSGEIGEAFARMTPRFGSPGPVGPCTVTVFPDFFDLSPEQVADLRQAWEQLFGGTP